MGIVCADRLSLRPPKVGARGIISLSAHIFGNDFGGSSPHVYHQVNHEDAVSELTSPVAGAFLLLAMTLRQCSISDRSQSVATLMSSQYVNVLDGSMVQTFNPDASVLSGGGGGGGGGGVKIPVVSLTAILKELLTFILSTS